MSDLPRPLFHCSQRGFPAALAGALSLPEKQVALSHFQLPDLEPDSPILAPLTAASCVGLSLTTPHAVTLLTMTPASPCPPSGLTAHSLAGLCFTFMGTEPSEGNTGVRHTQPSPSTL